MIFNNERYETVAFWDKYKHVKVYITAEKKEGGGRFHIAGRKDGGRSLPGAASCWDGPRPRLANVASPSKRRWKEETEHADPRTKRMMWRKKRKR